MSTIDAAPGAALRVAVVGAGPAGFYSAEAVLKSGLPASVDLFERLPVPFGLVRYGVAPDHQKIKAVTKTFDKIATLPGFRFLGNVEVGRDLTVAELTRHYDAAIFCVGCPAGRPLGVPGESLAGCHTAVDFVGWYNEHPDHRALRVSVDTERAVVVGAGDVATDLIRMLLRNPAELAETDIAPYALDVLRGSAIREVVVLVRRGPAEVRLAQRELEHLDELQDVEVVVERAPVEAAIAEHARLDHLDQKKLEYMLALATRPPRGMPKRVVLRFLVSPIHLEGEERVTRIIVEKNCLVRDASGALRPKSTGETEVIETGLVLGAIGYRGVALPELPFEPRSATFTNEAGRLVVEPSVPLPGLYTAGWIKRGPDGLIGTNRGDAFATVEALLADAREGKLPRPPSEPAALLELLASRGVRTVSYADWQRIDAVERASGKRDGRVRTKLDSVEAMLAALDGR